MSNVIEVVSAARRLSNLATAMSALHRAGLPAGPAEDLGSPEFQRLVAVNGRSFLNDAETEALGLAYGRVHDLMRDLADDRPELVDAHWLGFLRLVGSAASARAPGWQDRTATGTDREVLPLLAEGDRLTELATLCHPIGIRRMRSDAEAVVRRLLGS